MEQSLRHYHSICRSLSTAAQTLGEPPPKHHNGHTRELYTFSFVLFYYISYVYMSALTNLYVCRLFIWVQVHVYTWMCEVEDRGQPQVLFSGAIRICTETGFLTVLPAWNSPIRLDWLASVPQGSTGLHLPRARIPHPACSTWVVGGVGHSYTRKGA